MTEATPTNCLRERAELYYCLSRAFVAPDGAQTIEAMAGALPEDLAAIAEVVGYDFAATLADYRRSFAGIPDTDALLCLYSSLFLAPPRETMINTATYIDGALNGGSVAAMENLYRACGVERDENFRDLADHVAVQLEFVAYLYLREADAGEAAQRFDLPCSGGEFLHQFVIRWLPHFIADLETQTRARELAGNPYLELARVLDIAARSDARECPLDARTARAAHAIAAARQSWRQREIDADALAEIARKLEARGLSTAHLAIPQDRRDEAMGLSKKVPPVARRDSRIG